MARPGWLRPCRSAPWTVALVSSVATHAPTGPNAYSCSFHGTSRGAGSPAKGAGSAVHVSDRERRDALDIRSPRSDGVAWKTRHVRGSLAFMEDAGRRSCYTRVERQKSRTPPADQTLEAGQGL